MTSGTQCKFFSYLFFKSGVSDVSIKCFIYSMWCVFSSSIEWNVVALDPTTAKECSSDEEGVTPLCVRYVKVSESGGNKTTLLAVIIPFVHTDLQQKLILFQQSSHRHEDQQWLSTPVQCSSICSLDAPVLSKND